MNCVNHPAREAAAYCQQCGKPLCTECVRSVNGLIFCEACLAARLGMHTADQAGPYAGHPVPAQPSPVLAGILGIIPGVGAMYNGQLAKGLVHVLIFAILVSLANHNGVFGILIPAWILYQVFDAYHTAKAQLDGLPLPNFFGLNDLGTGGGLPHGQPPNPVSYHAVPPEQGTPASPALPVAPPPVQDREPVGAILLIVIGLFLLLQTLGIFHSEWIHRSWPLLIVCIGIWLLYRRTRENPNGGPE